VPFKMPAYHRGSPQINMPSMRGFMDPHYRAMERTGDIAAGAISQYVQQARERRQNINEAAELSEMVGQYVSPKVSPEARNALLQNWLKHNDPNLGVKRGMEEGRMTRFTEGEAGKTQRLGVREEGLGARLGIREEGIEDRFGRREKGISERFLYGEAGKDQRKVMGDKGLSPSQQVYSDAAAAAGKMSMGALLTPQEEMAFQKIYDRDPLELARKIEAMERQVARDNFEEFRPKTPEEYLMMAERLLEAVNPRPPAPSGGNLMDLMQGGQQANDPLGIR